MSANRTEYIRKLELKVHEYVATLEDILGTRDKRFEFRTVQRSNDDRPRTRYYPKYHTYGGCEVDINISWKPWDNLWDNQGIWQVAHECVHLLDPVDFDKEGSCYLEEGLARWFQGEPKFHDDVVRSYLLKPLSTDRITKMYLDAKNRVTNCGIEDLLRAVKEIRGSGRRIRDIKSEDLVKYLEVDMAIVEKLDEPWPENKAA